MPTPIYRPNKFDDERDDYIEWLRAELDKALFTIQKRDEEILGLKARLLAWTHKYRPKTTRKSKRKSIDPLPYGEHQERLQA